MCANSTLSAVSLGDATDLPLEDATVDCVVTSPPYNCGIEYDQVSDNLDIVEYEAFAEASAAEMHRCLVPGGRAWVNVTHAVSRFGGGDVLEERWNPAGAWMTALLNAGLRYRDTVVWVQTGKDQPTAWGSVDSPNAPNLKGRWEPILLFFKDTWKRGRIEKGDVDHRNWLDWVENVWRFNCAPRAGHPAPFPPELPRRCIYLSTWPGDVVLDPFAGSGTTVRVAKDLGRVGLGFDLSPKYVQMANDRLGQEVLAV